MFILSPVAVFLAAGAVAAIPVFMKTMTGLSQVFVAIPDVISDDDHTKFFTAVDDDAGEIVLRRC